MRLQRFGPLSLVAVLAIALLGFVRSAAAQDDAAKTRPPGGALTVGATASATVKAIDAEKRTLTLQKENGDEVQIKCGQEVRNFDQIKVGDTVKAAAIAQLVVSVGDSGAPANEEAGTVITRTPKGAKPGIVIARTEQVTVKIISIDPAKQTVTIQTPEGQPQAVQVAPDVDLATVKAGQDATVRMTKGIALWVVPGAEAQPAPAVADAPQAEPAAFAIEGATKTATVDSIDPAKRLVTLKTSDGFTRTIHLGKECINFDQIKVGDTVRATLADEIAVGVSKGGAAPSADASRTMVRAPEGSKPGVLIADSENVTGQIKSIDAAKGTITIAMPDGTSRTIKAGPDVKLAELKEGDDITARVTQALAIVVQKP